MEVYIILGILIILLTTMAVLLFNGKGAFLIAGYNTMKKVKKQKYNEAALCRFMGMLLLAIVICIIITLLGVYFKITWLEYFGIGIKIPIIISGLIYANTGNRFIKDEKTKK